jgi:hypothetical protein
MVKEERYSVYSGGLVKDGRECGAYASSLAQTINDYHHGIPSIKLALLFSTTQCLPYSNGILVQYLKKNHYGLEAAKES